MKCFVTGGCGFIGSILVDRLVEQGHQVTVYDNLSTGKIENISQHNDNENFNFIEADILEKEKLNEAIKSHDLVFHLAANSDIQKGTKNTGLDIEQNIIGTYNVLEAMKNNGIKKIVFTSSQVVYGETHNLPIKEDRSPLPTSMYGASKLSSEALICAYSNLFGMQSWILRLANIVGKRQSHGVVLDFINKLKKNPNMLEILGNGEQKKTYMLVDDCVDAIIFTLDNTKEKINIFNVSVSDWITVNEIAEEVIREMNVNPSLTKEETDRGWDGDIPLIRIDPAKLEQLGFKPRYSSKEAVVETIKTLLKK